MNREDIIRMAQECQLIGMRPHLDGIYQESLERFATLVAAAEREACAKVCEDNEVCIHLKGGKSLHPRFKDSGSGCDGDVYAAAIREVLEQPEQGPAAWRYNGKLHEFDPSDWATGPVTPLYTSPPAKPWVGLTDEEIAVIAAACGGLASDFVVDVARAIEQAHGITGETK